MRAEIRVDERLAAEIADTAERTLETLEGQSLGSSLAMPFEGSAAWGAFVSEIRELWRRADHVVLRGLPVSNDGASCLLAARAFGSAFKSYRGGKIVKHFRMSPWTTALSQTIQDGHFHTDLNTASTPPKTTLIQCYKPDPAAPDMGQVRVSRLSDLLASLELAGEQRTLEFMRHRQVQMVDERSDGAWTGTIVDRETIRYHPYTLRAAGARFEAQPDLEEHLETIRAHAFETSQPISLGIGDALAVSNRRALHYRGPCTVRFLEFPRVFEGREIFVLHLNDEPS